jgi:outer membrane protein assembly factor BamD
MLLASVPASASLRIRLVATIFALGLGALVVVPAARAELVWDPATGWRAEGGVFAQFLQTPEGRTAKQQLDAARRAEQSGDLGRALSGYKAVGKKYPTSVVAPEALLGLARVREKRGQFTKAQAALQKIVTDHPGFPRFNEVIGQQYRLAERMARGDRPRYWGWLPGFKQKDKGIANFEQVVTNAPFSEYAPLSLMNVASHHSDHEERDDAIDALDRMVNNYPESFLAPDAYLALARQHGAITGGAAYDQGSTQQALTYFQDYQILYPEGTDAPVAVTGVADSKTMLAESKMVMADFYDRHRGNYTAARVFYNEAITIYPESPVADRARAKLARLDRIDKGEEQPYGAPRPGPKSKRFWFF